MKVYLLIQENDIEVQGYYVGTETHILGVYGTRDKAVKAYYNEVIYGDPSADYHIVDRYVM